MKKKLLFLLLTVSVPFYAQIGFQENIVVGSPYTTISPQLVQAGDLDGDHDLDVITFGAQLNWYQNVDGLGSFGKKKTIAITNAAAGALFTVDFDKDGDLDILVSASNILTVYQNTNGLGNFEVMQSFTLGSVDLNPAVPSDIDGDGNIDIVCYYSNNVPTISEPKLVWFKNDGSGTFAQEKVITSVRNDLLATSLVNAEDLDGDGDQDIILGYVNYKKIAWLQNIDGKGTFSAPKLITMLAGGLSSITTADIDNDGDKDIISTSDVDNQIVWYKNTDGLGTFSDEIIIVPNAPATHTVLVTDINNDNKVDIVYTSKNEIG